MPERYLYSGATVDTKYDNLFRNVSVQHVTIVMRAVSGETQMISAKNGVLARDPAILLNYKHPWPGTQIK